MTWTSCICQLAVEEIIRVLQWPVGKKHLWGKRIWDHQVHNNSNNNSKICHSSSKTLTLALIVPVSQQKWESLALLLITIVTQTITADNSVTLSLIVIMTQINLPQEDCSLVALDILVVWNVQKEWFWNKGT